LAPSVILCEKPHISLGICAVFRQLEPLSSLDVTMDWGKQHRRMWRIGIAIVAVGLAVAGSRWLEGFATRLAIEEEGKRAEASVILLESSFRRELEKFRMASVVLAKDPDAMMALTQRSPQSVQFLNTKFEALSKDMQAASIYLLDENGFALSASNWRERTSFVGINYSFRAYYRQAMARSKHEQFALGNVSRRPGLYISRRIDVAGSNGKKGQGIVVIKVEFDRLEAEWQGYGKPAFVTNSAGIVLVTSTPEWRFKSIGRLSDDQQKSAALSRDFGDGNISQIAPYAQGKVARLGAEMVPKATFIEAIKQPSPEWNVHVLSDATVAVNRAVETTRLSMLSLLLLIASFIAIDIYRRRSLIARADLAAAERIRDLNDRLAHSNKLSILGQIAAGVGHEINQPLAAIGTYAANGVSLLDQGASQPVRENLVRIGALTARIGDITGELRDFARKSPRRLEPINVRRAVDGAALLLNERTTSLNAVIVVDDMLEHSTVVAFQGAIEQVLVNLIQNALDAAGKDAVITINLSQSVGFVIIAVRDNGPGLSEAALQGLFQPFATTKADGLGLGLVISRDLLGEFGGELTGGNHQGGCTFTLRLPQAHNGARA
jgi:two-component system, NtrC family, C4-dicarboxylate transport sensor histidine kinase DctB